MVLIMKTELYNVPFQSKGFVDRLASRWDGHIFHSLLTVMEAALSGAGIEIVRDHY